MVLEFPEIMVICTMFWNSKYGNLCKVEKRESPEKKLSHTHLPLTWPFSQFLLRAHFDSRTII